MSDSDITQYPVDYSGSLSSNLITGEQQVVTSDMSNPFHFIVPRWAPFFSNSLQIAFQPPSGASRPLELGPDYLLGNWFIAASRACAAPIYGSIIFNDLTLAGAVSLTYQTLGGIWTVTTTQIAEILADTLRNPRITAWDDVVDQPATFPVVDHEWDLVDLVGMSDVVTALQAIQTALLSTGDTGLATHIADHNNPHQVTATQVGLGNVENYPISDNTSAQTGTSNTLYMTPLTTAAAIAFQAGSTLASHVANISNPHDVTATQVGLGSVQNFGIAANADAIAGTSNTLYMTPRTTAAAMNSGFAAPLNNHISNFNNPHEVTATQVGLGNVRNLGTAQTADAVAGSSDNLYMTPLSTMTLINANPGTPLSNHLANLNNPHGTTAAQVGSYTSDQTDTLLAGKLDTTDQAVDSAKFGGQLPADFTASVLGGTAANATLFAGSDPATFTTAVLSGTAANASQLGGQTVGQLDSRWMVLGSAPRQVVFPAINLTGSPSNIWTELAGVELPVLLNSEDTALRDLMWMVAGGDSRGDTDSGLYIVRFASRGGTLPDVHMSTVNLGGVDTGSTFGFTLATDGGTGITTATLWMKSKNDLATFTVTELVQGVGQMTQTGFAQATEPTGIEYSA